jgi:hypothetical protein
MLTRCGDAMPKYNVYAYTPHAHARVATIEVRARDGQSAREKACTELQRQGREPAFLTLVPVQVGAQVNPFRV